MRAILVFISLYFLKIFKNFKIVWYNKYSVRVYNTNKNACHTCLYFPLFS
jgi:hypothetical protein